MIFDAKVEVACDYEECPFSTFVNLPAGARGTYLFNEQSIEKQLEYEGWTVVDGKHFCDDEECREFAKMLQEES